MRGFAGLAAVFVATLAVAGCGRSSMIGGDCPEGAHCVPDLAGADMSRRDMSLDMRPIDMLDMRPRDMPDLRGDMRTDMACIPRGPENCTNHIDDDCNGLIDCVDPACIKLPICIDKK